MNIKPMPKFIAWPSLENPEVLISVESNHPFVVSFREKLTKKYLGARPEPTRENLPDGTLVCIKQMARQIPCHTYFYSDGNQILISKVAVNPLQPTKVQSSSFAIEWLPSQAVPFVPGTESVEWLFTHAAGESFLDKLVAFCTFSFEKWKTNEPGKLDRLAIDALFMNSVRAEGSFSFFDLEWKLSESFSQSWFVLRNCFALGRFRSQVGALSGATNLQELYEVLCTRLGIEANYEKDLSLEAELQAATSLNSKLADHLDQLTEWFEASFQPSLIQKLKNKISAHYFSNPLMWFVPYLGVYLGAAALRVPVDLTAYAFLALHVLNLLGWILSSRVKIKSSSSVWFWIALVAAFMIPGAYLEFPSDAWEHLRRIYTWSGFGTIRENILWTRFAYFWGYSFLKFIPHSFESLFIDLYSTFWQMLLSIQVYRLSKRLHPSLALARLQVVGFWFLFGHNAMNFRYYALSATPLAYAAFFENLILILDLKRFQSKISLPLLIRLGFGISLMVFNHTQEVLLFSVMLVALGVASLPERIFKKLIPVTVMTLVVSWACYFVLRQHYPIEDLISANKMYDPFKGGYVSKWGTFRLWNLKGHYFETLGVFGVLSLALATLTVFRNRLISTLALTPTLLMLFPPFVLTLSYLTEAPNTYRVLYAFPTSFILVQMLYTYLPHQIITFLVILLMGISPKAPWRGKLRFQFERTPDSLKLSHQATLESWFRAQPFKVLPQCHVITDNLTGFYLNTKLNTDMFIMRNYPSSLLRNVSNAANYANGTITGNHSCMVIIPKKESLPPETHSWVAAETGHWTHQAQNLQFQLPVDSDFETYLKTDPGWKSFNAPPFYKVYIQDPCYFKERQCVEPKH